MSADILMGSEFGKALVDAGIIPPTATRVVIDIPVDGVVAIYVEQIGTRGLLALSPLLRGAEIRIMEKKT